MNELHVENLKDSCSLQDLDKVFRVFKPKKIEGMDSFVRDTAYKLIDAFVDDGQCDWINQYES